MKTPGVILPKDRQTTEVDELRRQAKEIEDKIAKIMGGCQHNWKLVGHRKMRRTLVDGVWQYTVTRPARVQCMKCGKREERRFLEICPICAGTDFTTTEDKHIKYFGPDVDYDSKDIKNKDRILRVYTCKGCGHQAVDASNTYLCTGGNKYELARPVTADKL